MDALFVVKGLNPATGRVMETTMRASSLEEAKKRAEDAGLTQVAVALSPENQVESGAEAGGPGMPEILVVDDREVVRYLLTRLLLGEGYAVTSASNGEKALTLLAARRPSLVIMDYHMFPRNGVEILREIRRMEQLRDLPIIIFTAGGDTIRDEAMRAGANAFVEKDTLDWEKLQPEIVRLAGPGLKASKPPEYRAKNDRSAC